MYGMLAFVYCKQRGSVNVSQDQQTVVSEGIIMYMCR